MPDISCWTSNWLLLDSSSLRRSESEVLVTSDSGNCRAMARPRPKNSLRWYLNNLVYDVDRREEVKPPVEVMVGFPGVGSWGGHSQQGEETEELDQHTGLTMTGGHRLLKLSRVISPLKYHLRSRNEWRINIKILFSLYLILICENIELKILLNF